MLIGGHVSSAGGMTACRARGEAIGCEIVQGFSQSPRQWRAPAVDLDVLRADRSADRFGIAAMFIHATYLINLATENDEQRAKSVACLTENLVASTALGSDGVVLHIGSHLGAGLEATLARIASGIQAAFDATEERSGEPSCRLLLENAAGAGYTVGRSFEELAMVIEACGGDARLGMCLDTQHLFASGIGYRTVEEADETVGRLDATVGLDRLGLIHLNDSKVAFGSNRDRHENLGKGEIGAAALGYLISSPSLDHVPAALEVPGDGDGPRAEDIADARAILAAGRASRRRKT